MRSPIPFRALTWLLLLAGLFLLARGLPACGTPGWDATGHAFVALRLAVALRELDLGAFFDELVRSDYYTALGRAPLALGFLAFGDGWAAPRAANCAIWIATIALAGRLARRLVPPERGDAAALWTVLFGLTSWLGVSFARSAFQEPTSALVTVLGCHLYLAARERGSRRAAFGLGLWLGLAIVVKSTYGLWLLAAVGLSALVDVLLPGPARATLRRWPAVVLGLVLPLAWWLVLPLPGGLALGAEHRALFLHYLEKAAILSTPPASYVPIWLGITATLTLAGFAVQLLGVGWGLARWRSAPHRLCATLAILAPAAIAAYPFRIDRFLVPVLFVYWALGGALLAVRLGRAPRRWRPALALAVAAIVFGTPGVGALTYASWFLPGLGADALTADTPEARRALEERRRYVARTLDRYRRPYAHRPAPASGPEGTEELLAFVAANLEPERPFAHVGGTGTELPPELVQWKLYQVYRRTASLYLPRESRDYLWEPLPGGEEGFRAWAGGFPQFFTLDPPDPLDRPGRDFERDYVRWMAEDPRFAVRARATVALAGRDHVVTVFSRRD